MQIILLEKVVNLGNLGDIVKVKDGYGRNFLIPQGKAKRATDSNKAEFEARRAELEKQQAALLDAAKERAKALSGFNLSVTQKAGVDGQHVVPVLNNVLRDDVPENQDGQYTEDILNNAPKRDGKYLVVKKILG